MHGSRGAGTVLPPAVETVAYRTAQEAMTNILKHAQASEVRIDVSDLEGVLTLEIADNGRGATPQDLAKLQSFGLPGLRERAQTVGGWLDVVTAPGQGMALIVPAPLDGTVAHQGDDSET